MVPFYLHHFFKGFFSKYSHIQGSGTKDSTCEFVGGTIQPITVTQIKKLDGISGTGVPTLVPCRMTTSGCIKDGTKQGVLWRLPLYVGSVLFQAQII